MIPLRDDRPTSRFPVVNVTFIAINVLVFLYQVYLQSIGRLDQFIFDWAAIPYDILNNPSPHTVLTLFTSMFMHGDWLHIGGNMLYLWIFGDNIEDTLGPFLYVPFYFVCGLAAQAAHILSGPNSPVPTLGASGAIAGVLGAYLVLFPGARVQTLIFMFRFARMVTISALWLLGFWFVLQLFSGVGSLGVEGGGVAYFAHVGGFVAGAAAMALYALARGIPLFQRY
jgi:membrane associated rhomboid family serine protease